MDAKKLEPIFVSVKDAAGLLAVCPRTVQNLVVAKRLRARKIGRRTLLSYRELLAFARSDHQTTNSTDVQQGSGAR
jgi:excisionase family DNA binding protein